MAMRAGHMVMGSIVVRGPELKLSVWNCTLTGWPPDSPPSSLARCARQPRSPRRELLQSAKRPARHSVSGSNEDVLHDLYF